MHELVIRLSKVLSLIGAEVGCSRFLGSQRVDLWTAARVFLGL